ncbi:MAG: ABC transporter substrate-binding protein, partial [Syntrophothermus sp.]
GGGEEITNLAHRLHGDTEGNPFFLVEIIKGLFAKEIIQIHQGKWNLDVDTIVDQGLPVPESIQDAIQLRVQALKTDVQNVLFLAAVLGREFDFDMLEAALGRGREWTLEAIDVLLRQRWIEEGSGPTSRDYLFVHHKIQEVVYGMIPRHRRQHLHALAANALERLYTVQMELVLDEVAYHYEQCHSMDPAWSEKAIHFLIKAGDRARDVSAFQDAVEFYERALLIVKQGKDHERTALTLIKIGQARHVTLDFKQSRQAYDEAFRSWRQTRRTSTPLFPPAPHPLRIQWREPATLDPARSENEWSRTVIGQLFRGLTALSGEGDVVPDMAYAWDIRNSGRQYIFYLREDATWSDGSPVTAEDYVYAWKRVLDPGNNSPIAGMMFNIRNAARLYRDKSFDPDLLGVQAIDEKTLEVDLERPDGFFLHLLPDFFPVPRQAVERCGELWTQPGNIVSNGPFLLEEWSHQRNISLVRNPRYTGRFPGNVEKIDLCLLSDMLAQYRLYETSQLDMLDFWTIPIGERNRARYKHTSEFISLPQLSTIYLCLDVDLPPFDDVHVRRSLAYAIDKDTLADIFMQGDVAPSLGGFLPKGMPAYSPAINIPFDPEQARLFLAQAGYSEQTGRVFPVIKGLLPGGTLAGLTDLLSQQWRKVLGIEIVWEKPGQNRSLETQPQPGVPLCLHGAGCEYPDPGHFIRWSEFMAYSHWRNEEFLALLEDAQQTTDPGSQTLLYRQADKLLMEEVPVIPLAYGRNLMLIKPWVKQYPVSPLFYWPWKEIRLEPH